MSATRTAAHREIWLFNGRTGFETFGFWLLSLAQNKFVTRGFFVADVSHRRLTAERSPERGTWQHFSV